MNHITRTYKFLIILFISYIFSVTYAMAYGPSSKVDALDELNGEVTDIGKKRGLELPKLPASGFSSDDKTILVNPKDITSIYGIYGSKDDLFELGIYQRGADFLVSKVIPDIISEYPIDGTAEDKITVENDEYCFDYKLTISNLRYDVPFDEDSLILELDKEEISGYLSSQTATLSGDVTLTVNNHAAWDWNYWYCFVIPEFDITLPFDIEGVFIDLSISLKKARDSIMIDAIKDIDIDVTELDIDGGPIESAIEAVLSAIVDIYEYFGEILDTEILDINTNLDDYVFDFAKGYIEEGVKPPMKEVVNQSLVEAFKRYDSSSAYDIDGIGLTFNLNPSDLTLIDGKIGLSFDGEINPVNYINGVTSDPSGFGITHADKSRSSSYAYVSLSQLFMNEVMDSYYYGGALKYSGSAVFDESFNLDYEISLGSSPEVHISESEGITVKMNSVNEAIEIFYSTRAEAIAKASISFDIEATLVPQVSGNAIIMDATDVAISNISVSSELTELGMSNEDISNFVADSVAEFIDRTISGKTISQSFFVGDYRLEVEEIEFGDYYTTIYLLFGSKSSVSEKSVGKSKRVNVETGKINYFDVGDNKSRLISALSSIENENSPKQKDVAIKKGKLKNSYINRFLSKSRNIFNKKKFNFWR